MKLQTKYLGEVEIDESNQIHFANGVPGFIDETDFVLLEMPGNGLFQILQSIKSTEVAFILTIPHEIYQDYEFKLDQNTIHSLAINDLHDVTVFSIVTLAKTFDKSTLNLKAPVIINPNNKRGKQLILNTDEYSTKTPITPQTLADKGGNK